MLERLILDNLRFGDKLKATQKVNKIIVLVDHEKLELPTTHPHHLFLNVTERPHCHRRAADNEGTLLAVLFRRGNDI